MAKISETSNLPSEVQSVPTDGMKEILERLNRLEAENEELKKTRLNAADRKKHYEGPRKFSYKMINGVPIVWLTTVSNEVRKNYKTGDYDINQVVELEFADGSKREFDYTEYGQSWASSEKQFPKEIVNRWGKNFYKFEKEGVEFEVAESVIN